MTHGPMMSGSGELEGSAAATACADLGLDRHADLLLFGVLYGEYARTRALVDDI